VDQIEKALLAQNLSAKGIHSNREQYEREAILNDFRNGKVKIIVATDILSRGIDVENISHVVNYNVPMDPEDYVHRIGRTARAGTTGAAITFVDGDDLQKFRRIEKFLGREVPKEPLPEGFNPPSFAGGGEGRGGSGGRGGGGRGGYGKKRNSGPGGGGPPREGGGGGGHRGGNRRGRGPGQRGGPGGGGGNSNPNTGGN
jgi:hypothetical protein